MLLMRRLLTHTSFFLNKLRWQLEFYNQHTEGLLDDNFAGSPDLRLCILQIIFSLVVFLRKTIYSWWFIVVLISTSVIGSGNCFACFSDILIKFRCSENVLILGLNPIDLCALLIEISSSAGRTTVFWSSSFPKPVVSFPSLPSGIWNMLILFFFSVC